MSFVRNCWYVIGWSHTVSRELSNVRVLDENIVTYRTRAGEVVALEDQCPHKRLPLSLGRLKGDAIECGYHGMTFGMDGRCVSVPGLKRPPEAAWVRHYPTHEANGIVWIWMGEPEQARSDAVLSLPQMQSPDWAAHFGDALHIGTNYLHLADNLCDPSHVAFVHPTTLGNPQSAGVPVEVVREGDRVITSRWVRDAPPVGFFATFGDFPGHVDRWHFYHFYAPNIAVIDFGSIDVKAQAKEADRDRGMRVYALHFLTPVSETETVDHWMHLRNLGLDDEGLGERMNEQFRLAFNEDKVILEAIQQREAKPRNRPALPLAIDKGAMLMKQVIAEMSERER